MKKVSYQIIGRGGGYTTIKFWTTDETDFFKDNFVDIAEEKLRNYVKGKLGTTNFKLVKVN